MTEAILVDTSAYTAFKRGHSEVIFILQQCEKILLTPIILGELFSGFLGGQREGRNRHELDEFLHSPRVEMQDITSVTSVHYSALWWQLRKKGKPIPSNDLWIAASAMETASMVLTFDRDFLHISGLQVKLISGP